jgi:prophage DNA circulation protein
MAWTDRLRPVIKFVSPSWLEFTPLWRGNDISNEKRLGRHAYPNLDKEVVQDLGMNSREIPLTVYFDGSDHDKASAGFEKALYEPGVWQVTHPVYGLMRLQLVSYKLSVEPVESGNVTACDTEWIEPADDESTAAIPDPAAEVESAVEAVNAATVADMAAVAQETVSQSKSVAISVRQGVNKIKSAIRTVNADIMAAQTQINEITNGAYMEITTIAGEVIGLIEGPGLMLGSISSKITMLINLGRRIMEDIINATAPIVNAAILVGQLFLNAITAGLAQSVISDMPETRREALSVLAEYRRFTGEAQAALDKVAALTANSRIENQFVARAQSGEAIAQLNAAVTRYLMGAMYGLKIERRMVLDRPRASLEIAITEYKASGEQADYYYELFCRTNNLHGRELLLLQAGREVVLYG